MFTVLEYGMEMVHIIIGIWNMHRPYYWNMEIYEW